MKSIANATSRNGDVINIYTVSPGTFSVIIKDKNDVEKFNKTGLSGDKIKEFISANKHVTWNVNKEVTFFKKRQETAYMPRLLVYSTFERYVHPSGWASMNEAYEWINIYLAIDRSAFKNIISNFTNIAQENLKLKIKPFKASVFESVVIQRATRSYAAELFSSRFKGKQAGKDVGLELPSPARFDFYEIPARASSFFTEQGFTPRGIPLLARAVDGEIERQKTVLEETMKRSSRLKKFLLSIPASSKIKATDEFRLSLDDITRDILYLVKARTYNPKIRVQRPLAKSYYRIEGSDALATGRLVKLLKQNEESIIKNLEEESSIMRKNIDKIRDAFSGMPR